MNSETITYMILAATGGITLGAFGYLIMAPAWTAYGRTWEKLAATTLTLFVLAAFIGTGVGVGFIIVYYWDSITSVFAALAGA
jgi:hypothetical protein